MKILFVILSLTFVQALSASAQEKFDVSRVPDFANKAEDFAPQGWSVEAEIPGDLNDDGQTDVAVKLAQASASPDKESGIEGDRVLVIALSEGGRWKRVAIAGKLLQCTECGGAFYGVMDAPANVAIEKGVLIVSQERGSRWVTETTYRFRYDEQPGMFILIGFDYASRDRAAGGAWTESTNYLTGKRITTIAKGKRTTKKTTKVAKMRHSIEEVDYEQFDADATKRLGLD